MNRLEAFHILGIDDTEDKKKIKRAYAALVKQYHPEEHPEKWQEIHEAYETAMKDQEHKNAVFYVPVGTEKAVLKTDFPSAAETNIPDKEESPEKIKRNEKLSGELLDELAEEQEIQKIFGDLDEQIEAKRIREQEELEKKIREEAERRRKEEEQRQEEIKRQKAEKQREDRKKWREKLVSGILLLLALAYGIGAYGDKIGSKKEKEKTWEQSLADQVIISEADRSEITDEADRSEILDEVEEKLVREFHMEALVNYGNENGWRVMVESGICLQEGFYLVPIGVQSDEPDTYTIRETEVPMQLEEIAGEDFSDCHVRAFCISSSVKARYMDLWCDLDTIGIGKGVRIFCYDEDTGTYLEREMYNGTSERYSPSEMYCADILEYRVFIINTHVHEEGEECEHPIVFVEKTDAG